MKAAKNGSAQRLSKDEWLEQALDILAEQGQAKLRIETICKALGVTRGSFYWHFKDRDDFVRNLVEFWSTRYTEPVIERISNVGPDSGERLKSLLYFVSEGGYARYDVSVRAWAAQEPDLVAGIVATIDERRLAFVGSLFADMGFQEEDAAMRARACIAYLTYDAFVLVTVTDQDRARMLNRFFSVITGP